MRHSSSLLMPTSARPWKARWWRRCATRPRPARRRIASTSSPRCRGVRSKLAGAMGQVRIGSGMDEGVTCGPMINEKAVADMDALVQAAIADGAAPLVGGARGAGPGYFYQPTVLAGVSHSSPIASQEIFGPIAPVISFTDTDAMIEQANDTEMGLMGYVYTRDLARGLAVSERIEAGMIGLNRGAVSDPAAPFGGMKQSGLGRGRQRRHLRVPRDAIHRYQLVVVGR
ncbi:MAG: aldehyde dehydrogenase family protein [Acidimicrobiales bacterium]